MVAGNSCFNFTYRIQAKTGKENILADSLSRLTTLGLYETNMTEKEGHEYGKCVFNLEPGTECSVDSSQKDDQDFEIDGIKN